MKRMAAGTFKAIGATALAEGMVLITKDERIRACKLLRTAW